jgi:hypothetical protein
MAEAEAAVAAMEAMARGREVARAVAVRVAVAQVAAATVAATVAAVTVAERQPMER